MADRVTRRQRQKVFQRAKGCCEYCRSQALYTTETFDVEHIIPTIRNGPTVLKNLALACSGCNGHWYDLDVIGYAEYSRNVRVTFPLSVIEGTLAS
jgi:5-methylcytosine-specific restriction endonuclease McrA